MIGGASAHDSMNALQNLMAHATGQPGTWMITIAIILAIVTPFYGVLKSIKRVRSLADGAIKAGMDVTVRMEKSTAKSVVIKLNKDAVERARDLLRAGGSIESVCQEIEPEYANWQAPQKTAFRRAIQMVITAEPSQDSPPNVSTQIH